MHATEAGRKSATEALRNARIATNAMCGWSTRAAFTASVILGLVAAAETLREMGEDARADGIDAVIRERHAANIERLGYEGWLDALRVTAG